MGPNTRRYNRFTGYTTEDCACEYCLYYGGKRRGCRARRCCCEEERRTAALRESAQLQQLNFKPTNRKSSRRISM